MTRDPPNKLQSSFGVVIFAGRTLIDPIVRPDIFLKEYFYLSNLCYVVEIP